MGIQKTSRILTEQEFNSSPLKGLVKYTDYVKEALKSGSAFTVAKLLAKQRAKDTSDNIKDSINGWVLEKEAQKDKAEQEYYASLAQMKAMEKAQEASYKKMEEALSSYGEDSYQYSSLAKEYKLSVKTRQDAETNWKIAGDKFMSANKAAYNAFLTSRFAN